ncbi:MAG TPA: metalloregulator ArsR/SmtB family transcription factor [Acidobacteriota bacterium]|nr:metalloregulator ArsR/SmtB family transcription factor [Acidobacteriota bacterium]
MTTVLVNTKIVAMEVFGALNTPRRREILRFVWNEERTVGEIVKANPDITYGAVSQHLRILEEAGLVSKRQEGLHHFYKAKTEELGPLKEWLESMWDSALYRLKVHAEIEEARRGPRSKKTRRKKS